MRRTPIVLPLLAALIVAIGAGCGDDPVSSFKPVVANTDNSFHFQMKDVKNHDTTMVYFWHMLAANIDQSAEFKGGSVSVTVADSVLQQVYATDLRQIGSFTTSSGTPGWWRITIVLKGFSGSIDFWALRRQ
jgi:hypothetical protein